MAITYVSSAVGSDTNQGATVTLPAGIQHGDLLLAVLGTNSVAYTHPAPSGWKVVLTSVGGGSGGNPGGSQMVSVFSRTGNPADSGAAVDFQVPGTSSAADALVVGVYRSDTANMIPLVDQSAALPNATAGTAIDSPQITVAELPSLLVGAATRKGGSQATHTWTVPSGFTQRALCTTLASSTDSVILADMDAAETGTTSVGAWTETTQSNTSACALLVNLVESALPAPVAPIFRRYTLSGWVPAIT